MKSMWLMLVLLVGVPAMAADMYSWTDANGVKHFSDSPPPGNVSKSQKLKFKGGVTSTTAAEDEAATEATRNSGPALAAAAGYAPEDIKRNCDIARKNLVNLDAVKPTLDASGNPTDQEAAGAHQAQVDKANQQIKLFCART